MDAELIALERWIDDEQRLGEAAERLGARVARTPHCARSWYLLGRLALAHDRKHDAFEMTATSLELNASSIPALQQWLFVTLDAGRWELSQKALDSLRQQRVSPEEVLTRLLGQMASANRLEDAEHLLSFARLNGVAGPRFMIQATRIALSLAAQDPLSLWFHAFRETQGDRGPVAMQLAFVLRERDRTEEDIYYLELALQGKLSGDEQLAAWMSLAALNLALGDAFAAERAWVRAMRLAPERAEAANDLGLFLGQQGMKSLGVQLLEHAHRRQPDHPGILCNLGKSKQELSRFEEARSHFRRAAELAPEIPLLQLREAAVFPVIFESREQVEVQRTGLVEAAQRQAIAKDTLTPDELFMFGCRPPFELQFASGNLCSTKSIWADAHASYVQQPGMLRRRSRPQLGIVVTKYHEGVFLRSQADLLPHLPSSWEIHVVADESAHSRLRSELNLPNLRLAKLPPDGRAVSTLRDLALDVLYYWEVGTDALNYFLPFYRLAPVQMTSWGIQVTSGIRTMDYYLSSRCVEPPDASEHYRESLLLSDKLLTLQRRKSLDPTQNWERRRWGLSTYGPLYVCAQQAGKLHPEFDSVLREILQSDAAAEIVLLADPSSAPGIQLRSRLNRVIGSMADRIRFVSRMPQAEYLGLLSVADVLLDPPHFGGVNSTFDGLSLNKPIVTQPSNFQRGRYTHGCYQLMGTRECTAYTRDDYVHTALLLTADRKFRQQAMESIAANSDRLFNDDDAALHFRDLLEHCMRQARA